MSKIVLGQKPCCSSTAKAGRHDGARATVGK
jgi:hypothetical protein